MVSPANVNVTSYHWTAMNCYNHSTGIINTCFYDGNKTGQNITGHDLLAQDAGTVTCTVVIDGVNYTSSPLTLRISGEPNTVFLCTWLSKLKFMEVYTFKKCDFIVHNS